MQVVKRTLFIVLISIGFAAHAERKQLIDPSALNHMSEAEQHRYINGRVLNKLNKRGGRPIDGPGNMSIMPDSSGGGVSTQAVSWVDCSLVDADHPHKTSMSGTDGVKAKSGGSCTITGENPVGISWYLYDVVGSASRGTYSAATPRPTPTWGRSTTYVFLAGCGAGSDYWQHDNYIGAVLPAGWVWVETGTQWYLWLNNSNGQTVNCT